MSLAAFGVRKPVVANLCMLAMIGAGLIFGAGLRREFFPEIRPVMVQIGAPYPGASPEEVERSLTIKIEDAVADLDHVKEITSIATEGAAAVTIEFESGTDIDAALADAKRRIDALQDLPPESERIVINKVEPNLPAISLVLFGDGDEREMKRAIQRIRDDLESLPGMGDVLLSGVRPDEITVEVRPEALIEHQLSLPEISSLVRQSMLELPGGSVRTPSQTVVIRTLGADQKAEDIRRIVVKADDNGQVLRLGDIASVTEGFADVDLRSRVNGQRSVSLTAFKSGDEDIVEIADMVKAYVAGRRGEAFHPTLKERLLMALRPPGSTEPVSRRQQAHELGLTRAENSLPGELRTTTDLARFVVGRLDLLTRNALWGACLVFLVLMVFLSWRSSFWVLLGLVVSISGTLVAMRFLGVTLNLLTMFGLIIVLGLLVDDAIVVAENISSRHERGESAMEAAVKATEQVGWPVVATVLTTIFAFLPFSLIEGQMGDMLEALPIVVGVALGVSLIEALFILPVHMGHSLERADLRRARRRQSRIEAIELRFDAFRDHFFQRSLIPAYERFLRFCVRRRYLSLLTAVSTVSIAIATVASGHLPFILFENTDSETVNIQLRMPIGTPIDETDAIVRRIETAAAAQPEIDYAVTTVGATFDLNGVSSETQSHLAQIILELKPVEKRDRTSAQVRAAILEAMGPVSGVRSLRMQEIGAGPEGPAITLAVTADHPARITPVVDRLTSLLAEYDGVYGITDDADAGQRELRISLRPGASELGFTTELLAQQLRGAVFGIEAHTFAGNREDVDVRVTFPTHVRRNLAAIERLFVKAPRGGMVPLSEIARLEETEGYATARRIDRRRAVTVTADVNEARANPEEIMHAVNARLPELLADAPGVRVVERGRQKDFRDSMASLPLGMLVACGLIYVCLAWLFQSYIQPLIVMTAIPFAIIGVVVGHLLLGFKLTFLSQVGFIALAGIVVNDSLIFMEFFNAARRERGLPIGEACIQAGTARFRAIILTTVTTVAGLLPILLETSYQARFLIPMAITISFGLISATALILVLLPCLLVIFDDARRAIVAAWTGNWTRGREHAPPGMYPAD